MPAVQLTTHVKSSTLYGRTSKFFRLDGLLLFCIIMELRSASSAIIDVIDVIAYREMYVSDRLVSIIRFLHQPKSQPFLKVCDIRWCLTSLFFFVFVFLI